jgi:hypothetical protein
MAKTVIEYGLSTNYVSTWGYKEAIREIVQNFIDFGEYGTTESDYIPEIDGTMIRYQNEYKPESFEFLKVGFSKKHSDNAVGKYGEGLKIALLVLHRLGVKVSIGTTINEVAHILRPVFYDDPYLGKCFGIEVEELQKNCSINLFTVSVQKTSEYDEMEDYFIDHNTEVIFENYHGAIVDMPAGNIYVGGIFVANYDDIPRAYNLKPQHVDLGRDRNFPNTWDVEYHCSKIFQEYCESNETIMEHSSREIRHMDTVPEKFAETIEPTMINGNIVLNSTTVGVLSGGLAEAAKKNPKVMESTRRLMVELTKRQSPEKMLKNFNDKFSWHFSSDIDAKNAWRTILDKSKGWK